MAKNKGLKNEEASTKEIGNAEEVKTETGKEAETDTVTAKAVPQEQEPMEEAEDDTAELDNSEPEDFDFNIEQEESEEKAEPKAQQKAKTKAKAKKSDILKVDVSALSEIVSKKFPGLELCCDGKKIIIDLSKLKENTPRLLITNAINAEILTTSMVEFKKVK